MRWGVVLSDPYCPVSAPSWPEDLTDAPGLDHIHAAPFWTNVDAAVYLTVFNLQYSAVYSRTPVRVSTRFRR